MLILFCLQHGASALHKDFGVDKAVESVVRRLWLACVADSGVLSSTFRRRVCNTSLLCSLSGRQLRALLTALNVPSWLTSVPGHPVTLKLQLLDVGPRQRMVDQKLTGSRSAGSQIMPR